MTKEELEAELRKVQQEKAALSKEVEAINEAYAKAEQQAKLGENLAEKEMIVTHKKKAYKLHTAVFKSPKLQNAALPVSPAQTALNAALKEHGYSHEQPLNLLELQKGVGAGNSKSAKALFAAAMDFLIAGNSKLITEHTL